MSSSMLLHRCILGNAWEYSNKRSIKFAYSCSRLSRIFKAPQFKMFKIVYKKSKENTIIK